MTAWPWAVIGSGISGLACARSLARRSFRVRVLDKGRHPGGRMATRVQEGHQFDHGAQFFTVRSAAVARAIDDLNHAGAVAVWSPRALAPDSRTRLVGLPRMNAVAAQLARDLEVQQGALVVAIEGDVGHYSLVDASGRRHGPFVGVVVTAPGPQSARLLRPVAPDLAAQCDRIRYAPCWVVMVALEAALAETPDWLESPGEPLQLLARDTSKPGRPPGERWVLHASHAFSEAHLEATPESVRDRLEEAARQVWARFHTGPLPVVLWVRAHRFRYARVEQPLGQACVWEPARQLGLAGDGMLGPRVEDAWRSGLALAEAITRDAVAH